ncbi:YqaJ viral recombinase family protein [Maricaulis sp.]|jgi:predicted phage-related endonuclease|uniref:YqaJ viral recombinase family protein n=1 Tax=Maricaulis sp. TaxID=1486257 RepID=UPI0026183335|nr:YqaJ viral recombinase family protein [Maricaulis sp.]MDF1769863.1 YqaJ viral recombinase family protein [Maricaulis sp.]
MTLPLIADLNTLGLSAAAIAGRAFTLGGSDANIIASGDVSRIHRLWEEKTGRAECEDLSGVLPVQMGNWTEPLNAAWYTKQTGDPVVNRDEALTCLEHSWRTATLDGYCAVQGETAVWEAKHVNAFAKPDDILEKYLPQLHHNMDVAGCRFAVLSVFRGNLEWMCRVVEFDEVYAAELLEIEKAFYAAMMNDEPPVDLPQPKVPVKPSDMRTVDMTGSNEWAAAADDYLTHAEAKRLWDRAAKNLKAQVEDDVKTASGHGIIINRDARGALRIKEEK